jgi:hypothetical protein
MARNETIYIQPFTWVELTSGDVAGISFQNLSDATLWIQATTASAPPNVSGSIEYQENEGERNVGIADLFPGVAGADRIWAWSEKGGPVFVSHN